MKIGVLGGTFDPPHVGHLQLARAALEKLQLDLLLWVPNRMNPLKDRRGKPIDPNLRLEMIRSTIQDEPNMAVTDIEITRDEPSYTYVTLEELQAAQPGADFWLVLGADSLDSFMNWHYPERILRVARLAVAVRPGTDLEALLVRQAEQVLRRIDLVEMEPLPASSTEIRERVAMGKDASEWLHPEVIDTINQYGLYRKEN